MANSVTLVFVFSFRAISMPNTYLRVRERKRNEFYRRVLRFLLLVAISEDELADQATFRGVQSQDVHFLMLLAMHRIVHVRYPLFPSGTVFQLSSCSDAECRSRFRFDKKTIMCILRNLRLPDIVRSTWGTVSSNEEALCIFLYRMSRMVPLADFRIMFGGHSASHFSFVYRFVLEFVYKKFVHLLRFPACVFSAEDVREYTAAVRRVTGLANVDCYGFVDGTFRAIARPVRGQQFVYSGYYGGHGLKYLSIVVPSGLLVYVVIAWLA